MPPHEWALTHMSVDPKHPDEVTCEACGIVALRFTTHGDATIEIRVTDAVRALFRNAFGETFRPEDVPRVPAECEPPYTGESVKRAFEPEANRLFAPWLVGRPEGYTPDPRTKELVGLSYWLREELGRLGLNEADRKTQEGRYHRESRSQDDLFAVVARVLNEAKNGVIPQNRVPHRRWG